MSKTVNDDNRQGFFWHVHHGILIEWCHSYDERAEYIRTGKSPDEQETRLRLFQPVKGSLPEEVIEARRALNEAWRVYNKARRAFFGTSRVDSEAYEAYVKATRAFNEAVSKNMSKIEALHAEECPNCPWNGHTIFPKA